MKTVKYLFFYAWIFFNLAIFSFSPALSAEDRMRAGTIEIQSKASAKDRGTLTSGFNLTNMEINESLKLEVVFKKDRESERIRVYELDRAAVDFQSGLRPGRTGVEAEAGLVEMNVADLGQMKRALGPSECELTLYIDLEKKAYRIAGRVSIEGIPFSSKGKLTSQIVGALPMQEDLSDEWTEDREEEIEINGSLDPEQKDILMGSQEIGADAPAEFREWTHSLWGALFGGEMRNTIIWDIRVPMLIIEKDEEDITDPDVPVEEMVGKKIKLVGKVEPSHLKASDPEWRISGKSMKEFKADTSSSEVVPLDPNQDLSREEVEFYWYDKGEELGVEYRAEVEGEDLVAVTRFSVEKPEISLRTEPQDSNEFKTLYTGESLVTGNCCYSEEPEDEECRKLKEEIGKLNENDPFERRLKQKLENQYREECEQRGLQYRGIVFEADPPADMKGELQYIQLVERTIVEVQYEERGGRIAPGKMTTWFTEEALDGCYPYPMNLPPYSTMDMPGFGVAGGSKYKSVELKFKMCLMFKPESEEGDSQWVPVKVVFWTWKGAVECFEGDCHEVREDAVFPGSDLGEDISEYPIWKCCSGNAGTAKTTVTIKSPAAQGMKAVLDTNIFIVSLYER